MSMFFCSAQYHLIILPDVMNAAVFPVRVSSTLTLDPLKMYKSLLSSHSCPLIFSSSVITNTEEWRYFKALTRTPTALEENMFHLEEGAPGPRVYLRPKESIHIPLKYQSFLCDHTMALQVQWRPEVDADGAVRTGQFIKPCFRNGNYCSTQYFLTRCIVLYFSSQMHYAWTIERLDFFFFFSISITTDEKVTLLR